METVLWDQSTKKKNYVNIKTVCFQNKDLYAHINLLQYI